MRPAIGLSFRLTALILVSVTAIFLLAFVCNHVMVGRILRANIENGAFHLTRATVHRIEAVLRAVEKAPTNLARFIEDQALTPATLKRAIEDLLEANPEVYGAAVAFAPGAFDEGQPRFALYGFRSAEGLVFTTIPYDYLTWDWYRLPMTENRCRWSEPYFDEGAGNVLMATFSVPLYASGPDGARPIGVVTADISLAWLHDLVGAVKIARSGYAFLISRQGRFITHPRPELVMNQTIFTLARSQADPAMATVGTAMTAGDSGFAPAHSLLAAKGWLSYAALPAIGWSLGVVFPEAELMGDLWLLNRRMAALAIAGLVVVFVVVVVIARSIVKPIAMLSDASAQIADGNLDLDLPPVARNDEVGRLALAFAHMKDSLRRYIADLTEATAARQRMESELQIAREIQMGILPKTFPPFPERSDLDIHAALIPAREVGGDLYDFFFLDEDHLCFTVGDVSGKGVPAALFMTITNTLVKTKATRGLDAATVLSRVNQDLSLDNPSLMFVTLFLGILDLTSGRLDYCNGGHNPPYRLGRGGAIEELPLTGGMALGLDPDFVYASRTMVLEKGDTLFLFSDGVTEALNPEDKLFTDARLRALLAETLTLEPAERTAAVLAAVTDFAGSCPQADDITVMQVHYTDDSTR